MEAVSNPIAPEVFASNQDDVANQKLSNSDFRKLLMTPRPATHHHHPVKDDLNDTTTEAHSMPSRPNDPHHHRSKQKQVHKQKQQKHKRDSQKMADDQGESIHRYRDRAKERRAGKTSVPVEDIGDDREADDNEHLTQSADYRAVAPSLTVGATHAERRHMIIQESKYLGGDMEHTHLVKGLDYVLLQKVRLEIQNKEFEAEQILDTELAKPPPEKLKDAGANEDGLQFSTRLGANICDVLFNPKPLERNEYFYPGRMTYRIELEDDSVDFEVPATVIHSKSDCLQVDGRGSGAITTNEIVINKLTQILSYLRAGKRHAKKNKLKGRAGVDTDMAMQYADSKANNQVAKADIFDGAGSEYIPSATNHNSRSHRHTGANESSSRDDKKSRHISESLLPKSNYFEKDSNTSTAGTTNNASSVNTAKEFMSELNQRFGMKDDVDKGQEKASIERFFEKTKVTCYDECYPGFAESYDDDSDDEADFTKMDTGNKKGPVGRWDFETQEEYSEYMSHKEALPKAAFQYGLKMAGGRRTKRIGMKDDKAELDKQLQQIQSIIQKRKTTGETGGSSTKNSRY